MNRRKNSEGGKKFAARFAKSVIKWKYLIFAVAILLSFGSQVVAMGNEVGMRVVITSLGIDKAGEEYRVSAQVFTPQLDETKTPIKSVVSVTAPTLAEAISQMNFKTGRLTTISHCRLIVLGDSVVKEDNILKPLNFFMTDNEISWGAIIVATSGEAKEMLSGLNTLEQKASFSWQKFLNSNRENDVITVMSLRELLIRFGDKSQSALINIIDVEGKEEGGGAGGSGEEQSDKEESGSGEEAGEKGEEKEKEEKGKEKGSSGEKGKDEKKEEADGKDKQSEAGQQSGGEGKGGENGQGGGQEEKMQKGELKLAQQTLVFHDGELKGDVSHDEVRGYSWLDPKVTKATFIVQNVDDPLYRDALISVRMRKRKVVCDYREQDGMPCMTIKIRALFENTEVLRADHPHRMTEAEIRRGGDRLQEAIAQEIEKQITEAYHKSLELGSDFLQLNERFFRYRPALYDRYGEELYRNVNLEFRITANLNR